MTGFIRTPILERGAAFEIFVDGRAVTAVPGESIAAALLAAGRLSFRNGPANLSIPRGVFCGMGACYGCLVTVDGVRNVRACCTPARPGQQVELNGHEQR
jgi:predicted molibdopterin-dependent oxidoreductase YjgC